MRLFHKTLSSLLLLTALAGFQSCSKDSPTEEPANDQAPDYAVWLQVGSWPNTFQYVVGTNSLKTGVLSLSGNGVEVTGKADYGIIPHGGFYYYPSTSSNNGKFSKFKFENNQLTAVKEVPFTYQKNVSSYTWVDDNTLVLIGVNGDSNKILYSVVNATTLAITNGELSVPASPTGYPYLSIGTTEYTKGKLFVGFMYTGNWPAAYRQVNVGVFDYPAMTLSKVVQDDKTTGAGGISMWEPASFVTSSGDLYHLATPGSSRSSMKLPSVLYRIKNGTTEFDASFKINLSDALGGSVFAMWNIGNGEAVVKYEDPKIAASGSKSSHIYGFAIVNLSTGAVTKKLTDIPYDNSETLESVTIDNGKAYILSNAETGKDYVWEYDPTTGKTTPGLELQGGYNYMLRVDKLKN